MNKHKKLLIIIISACSTVVVICAALCIHQTFIAKKATSKNEPALSSETSNKSSRRREIALDDANGVDDADNTETSSKEIIYETTWTFAFGSRSARIYDNGDVYEDLEIEEPNHTADYEYVKTLTVDELAKLKSKIAENLSDDELADFVIELVYGAKEFGNRGEY